MSDKLRFEERELRRYGQPVSAKYIKEGQVYFSLGFARDMRVPVMETLVYIGKNLDPGVTNTVYFQDALSYYEGVRYETDPEGERSLIYLFPEDQTKGVFVFERALDLLLEVSLAAQADEGTRPN